MYDVGKKKISRKLQNRISGFLETDDESRERIKASVKEFYDARSEIVHGRTDKMSPLRTSAAFVKGFKNRQAVGVQAPARGITQRLGRVSASRGALKLKWKLCAPSLEIKRIRWDARLGRRP